MKTLSAVFILLLLTPQISAQEEEDKVPPNGWKTEGNVQLLFNQSAFNKEWTGGGTSSISGNLIVNYDINYRLDSFTWDTRMLGNYGISKLKSDRFARKTSDRLEINSITGKQMNTSNWYFSYFLNFRTQFDKGYTFGENQEGDITRTETTNFLSPAYLQTGPGIMWKKRDELFINLAPATARLIFVDDKFTTGPDYVDGEYFGLDAGKSLRFELGASLSGYAKFDLFDNVSMENTISFYSNYLEKPGNIDLDYLMNMEMDINKYLTANILFQAIYDDNAVAAFQIREVFGLGLNYDF